MNESDEGCGWVHQENGMNWIIQKLHLVGGYIALRLLLKMVFNCTEKQRMRVIRFESECIENMEWV